MQSPQYSKSGSLGGQSVRTSTSLQPLSAHMIVVREQIDFRNHFRLKKKTPALISNWLAAS